jgi:hypothetical protein
MSAKRVLDILVVTCVMATAGILPAVSVATPGPGWSISSLAQPTNFSTNDTTISGEVQNVYVDAAAGTFTLAYEGETTAPINYSATAAEVQAALVVEIGAGKLSVTGGPTGEGNVSRWVVTFAKSVGEAAQLEANGAELQGAMHTARVTSLGGKSTRDGYTLTVTNTGGASTSGIVTIKDTLPPGVTLPAGVEHPITVAVNLETEGFNNENPGGQEENGFTCTTSPSPPNVQCEYSKPMPPGDELAIRVRVAASEHASGSVTNFATVEGGVTATSPSASTSEPATMPNTLNGPLSSFGIHDFSSAAYGQDGLPDTQAGDHPNMLTTRFDLTSKVNGEYAEGREYSPIEEAKGVVVDLPLGLAGDPLAAPQCLEIDLLGGAGETICPSASRVGMIDLEHVGHPNSSLRPGTEGDVISAIYNMVPENGYPAVFGFNYEGFSVVMYASVVHTAVGYELQVTVPGVPRAREPEGASLTFFGDPAERDGGSSPTTAFFTNPASCSSGPLNARIEADSWLEPANWQSKEATVYPQVTGCNMLQFNPTFELKPETTQADTPSGYEVDLSVPQARNLFPDLATPDLKNATVTLPEGLSVSPSTADGLVGCQATGPEGIDFPNHTRPDGEEMHPDEAGEGEEIGADGLSHLAPGHCPAKSKVGEVEIETPVLPPHTLKGSMYVAEPTCGVAGHQACTEASATNGELYGIYLEVAGSGVVVKLRGKVEANPGTGRLTTTFSENPQLPFSELKLKLKGGERAPLANPQTCGVATATSSLEPWSAPESGASATPLSSFGVSGCGSPQPFAPGFLAQTSTPIAGGFSPFTLTFSRSDGEQNLSGLTVTTPPGLLGVLKSVVQCPEPEAQKGECGPQSLIGHTQVAAGAGSHPFWESGTVYLTGPYKDQPFGLSIVVPAVAGPFNLGNVIVRAAIHVDPKTSALTVTSDPLPQIIDGVPLRIQTASVNIDRSGFMFNPTNCSQEHVTGTISAAQGASASVSSPFAVGTCKNLPFKPKFSASTAGKASKAGGASLDVKVSSKGGPQPGGGEANIKSVKVDLPKQLPSRLTTLQKACTAKVFEANPASCPKESNVGMATASTAVLAHPLIGPAYLVSHGGVAFPDLEIVLQGEGIALILDGNTQIKKGITSSTFKSVPDAPISSFELKFPTGKFSILGTNVPQKSKYSLCGQTLAMPTAITGQNGAVVKQTTKISITGCPKPKKSQKIKRKTKPKRK